mmetsp:Transcript_64902/g.120782  ORF Transcript_64902/g.120782 Transcript_64902/m.120782 type:complete len:115 (+) Transcript_64902:420-764(+)
MDTAMVELEQNSLATAKDVLAAPSAAVAAAEVGAIAGVHAAATVPTRVAAADVSLGPKKHTTRGRPVEPLMAPAVAWSEPGVAVEQNSASCFGRTASLVQAQLLEGLPIRVEQQ